MVVIDADGHVEESPATFSYLEKEYYPRRPLALGFDDRDTVYGSHNAVWLIDGVTYPKLVGKGGVTFKTPTIMEAAQVKPISTEAQEMIDVAARLKDLDKAGINKQVVYPTLFLTTTTDDVALEAALFRSYNSFMADACSKSEDRIKFGALVPIRDIDESVRELRRAKSLGAASVVLMGVAWDRSLGDEALFPFYEAAATLDIPICVHFGWCCPAITDAFEYSTKTYAHIFNSAVLPVLMGFHNIMSAGVLDTFPGLRLAFLEAGSLWLPFVIHQLRGRMKGKSGGKDPAQYFREGRIYVACEADEDINYLIPLIGEDCLVTASDYPHFDPSHEENITGAIMGRTDLDSRVKEKILSNNSQRLYGLSLE